MLLTAAYAENLVNSGAAAYNPGEYVEGYSSPLWMLIQSLGIALGLRSA